MTYSVCLNNSSHCFSELKSNAIFKPTLVSTWFLHRNTNTVLHSSIWQQSNLFHALIHVVEQSEDSHPDNVLHVKILQWCDVRVVTFVIL